MCEAGRILHHLYNNISDPRNTVLIIGYQAQFTLGRKLVEQEKNRFNFWRCGGKKMRSRCAEFF